MGGNITGCPVERLLAGERFSVGFAPVEKELSRKVGGVRYAAPSSMRNEWTTLRIKDKVSGAIDTKGNKIGVALPKITTTPKGDVKFQGYTGGWMEYEYWTLMDQWDDYKNNALMRSTSNRNSNGEYMNFGDSGEVIRMGDGLLQQLHRGNIIEYGDFSLKLIEEALYQISTNRLDYGQRTFVLTTGEKGASEFSKAVKDTVSGWTFLTLNGDALGAVAKTSSPFHSNSLKAGFQFTEYLAPNGVIIKVKVDPFYDDPVHNKIMHPKGGPAMSYRFDIYDLGTPEVPNIQLCKIKGKTENWGYEAGMRNPFTGAESNAYMSHDEDSATFHMMTTLGVCILDPTRCMTIMPSILNY